MVQGFSAPAGRLHIDPQLLAHPLLTNKIVEGTGPDGHILLRTGSREKTGLVFVAIVLHRTGSLRVPASLTEPLLEFLQSGLQKGLLVHAFKFLAACGPDSGQNYSDRKSVV